MTIKNDAHFEEISEVFNAEWNNCELSLTPEDRKEIYRKKAAQLLAQHQGKQQMKPKRIFLSGSLGRFRKTGYAAAAAILFALLIPAAYLYLKTQTSVQYVETSTQRGEIKTIFLPDRTEVTLNAGSRLKYSMPFPANERPVELYGEALFNVTSDPKRPFTVKTENLNIKVLGTVFDVKEYAEDLTASVSVTSGKVNVDLIGGIALLEKNQQLQMEKSTGLFKKTSFDAAMSWKDGELFFQRTPIREVVNILNRRFPQVDIVLAEGQYPYLISGKHEKDASIEKILTYIIYTTDLKCKKTGNKYSLY